MDACADHGPAFGGALQRRRHQPADRGEDERGIEGLWRPLVRAARPDGAERLGEALRRVVAGSGEGEDAASLMARDLRYDVCRRAEAVDAKPLGVTCHTESAIADQSCAKERRRRDVVI